MAPNTSKHNTTAPIPTHRFEPRPFISQTRVAFETPSTIVYDTKFDTAMRASQMEQHYARMKNSKPTHDDNLIASMRHYPAHDFDADASSKTFSTLMLMLRDKQNDLGGKPYFNNEITKTTNRTFKLIHKNIILQSQYLNSFNFLLTNNATMAELKMICQVEMENLSYINSLLDFANWWLGVINSSNTMYAAYYSTLSPNDRQEALRKVNNAEYAPLGLTIEWSHSFCVMHFAGEAHLLPKSYILMMHNKICDILSVLIYAKYARHSNLPKTAYEKTVDFLEELWSLNKEFGQSYFTIAKCLEALSTAETLAEVESWDNREFLKMILKDLINDVGFSYQESNLRMMLKNANVAFRHELGCLSKLGGHPFVDMKDGSEKIHKYTTEEYDLDYDKINECLCYAKQNYIRNYIVRENKWPPSIIESASAPLALRKAQLMNRDPESYEMATKYGRIKVSDYNFVELQQEMKYNMLENAIPHLKDKTISITRTAVVSHFINREKDSKVSWRDTRLLLYYLLRDEESSDHVNFIKEYSRSRDFDDFLDYLIIRIVPKEKELKVAYRGFGCTTFHNRMLFLSQEKNAMHYLDLYCDEQAMTLSEIDLVRRLYAFRCLKAAYPKHKVYYATIDASKWNNHFRPETCDIIMSELLDRIFGVNIFGKTQAKYESTMFYVPDGDDVYHWEGQSGGIEGLNQDTWVVTYISQIKTSLSEMNVKYHVLCKGDDLRLAILIPESDVRANNMKATGISIMEKLSAAAKGLGHDIKIYESYGSERYFSFSKSASIDRVEMPQAYRKVQKCYGATNAFLPTYDEYIASTYSNAHSACRVTTNVIPCYCVALFWANYYLLSDTRPHHLKLSEKDIDHNGLDNKIYYSDRTDDELLALLLSPGLVGGFPIIYLHNMMVRAESDLLPPFIDIYQFCKKAYPTIHKVMANFLYFDTSKKKTWKPLYSDPYCLPLRKPLTAAQKLRSYVQPALQKLVRNDNVRELLELVDNDTASVKCIKSMDASSIVHAKIFGVLFSALPESLLTEIVNKFENARSVLEILILRSGSQGSDRMLRAVVKTDREVQKWRKNRLIGNYSYHVHSVLKKISACPAKSAFDIRAYVWGKEVNGITMPPITHLLSYMTQPSAIHSQHARQNHFQYTIQLPTEFISGKNNFHYAVGNSAPFLGKITSSATTRPVVHMVEKDVILSKLKTIAELSSWANRVTINDDGTATHSNVDTMISKIMRLYTDEPLSTFSPLAGSKLSGTAAHHVRTRQYRESIVPNSLSNVYQLVQGDTAQHQGFFSNRNHFWINFLHCFCHAVNMLTFELNVRPFFTTPEIVWVITNSCEWCTRVVDEPAVIIDEDILKHARFPSLKMTRLNKHTLHVLKKSLGLANLRPMNIDGNSVELSSEQATIGLFNNLLDSTIRKQGALTDRYTQHPDNPEGRKVLTHFVPQNYGKFLDMKDVFSLDTPTLTNCLIICIFRLMCQHVNLRRISELDSLLLVMPSYTLPWYPLVESLHKAGKLAHIVRDMANNADIRLSGVMFTPEQISPHIGSLVMKLIGTIHDTYPLVLLSNYQMADMKRVVMQHVVMLIWQYYYKSSVYFNDPDQKDENIKACATVILLLACNITREDNQSEIAENIEDGEVRLQDIAELDHDGLDDMLRNMEDSDPREVLYPYLQIVSHLCPFSQATLIDHILANVDAAQTDLLDVYEAMTVTVISATPLNCLETLKLAAAGSSSSLETPDYTESVTSPLENFFIVPAQLPKDYMTVVPPFELDSMKVPIGDNKFFEIYDRRNVGNEYMHRPLGSSNDTVNRLTFINHWLRNKSYKGIKTGISLHSLGDGMGNGTSYFLTQFRQMKIVYTTRPESRNDDVYPIICEDLIEQTRSLIYHQHVGEGIFDLSHKYVLDHLHQRYYEQHLYFCDAEPAPGDDRIFLVYNNVIHYFLRSRSPHSILIMQLSMEKTNVYLKHMAVLQQYCMNIIVVLPPSTRCIYSHYIVVWGIREPYNLEEYPIVNEVPTGVINAVESIFAKMMRYYDAQKGNSNSNVDMTISTYVYDVQPASLLTPLWASYCQKYLNAIITNDSIAQLKDDIVSQTNKRSVIMSHAPRFEEFHTSYMRLLHGKDTDPVSRVARYDMNYHTHRIHVVRVMMMAFGWEVALRFFSSGQDLVPMKILRSIFLDICCQLPRRDYDPEIKYKSIFGKAGMTHPNGHRMDYWTYFCRGVEFFLSYLAWCRMMEKANRSARYYD